MTSEELFQAIKKHINVHQELQTAYVNLHQYSETTIDVMQVLVSWLKLESVNNMLLLATGIDREYLDDVLEQADELIDRLQTFEWR